MRVTPCVGIVLLLGSRSVLAAPASQVQERQELEGGLVREKLLLPGWDPSDPVPAIALYGRAAAHAPVVFLFHWFQGSKEVMEPWAQELARAGFFALAVDCHLHGERKVGGMFARPDLPSLGEEFSVFVHQSAIAHTARDFPLLLGALAERPAIDTSRVGVAGISMGASLALVLAWQDERVTAAASLVGAADFWWDVTKLPPGPEQDAKRNGYGARVRRLVESIDPRPHLERYAPRAVFIANGRRDGFIAIDSMRRVADDLRTRYTATPERFRFLEEDAGHEATDAMRAQANAWLARFLCDEAKKR